jgi:ATP-binding cassette subfamily B protein
VKQLVRFIKPYWLLFILLVGFTYLQVMANLKLPDYMAKIVNEGIIAGSMHEIYHSGLVMLLVTLGGAACAVGVSYLASHIATGFTRDVRQALFSRVERFSINEFNTFSTASLITRSTNDMQQLQQALTMMLRMMLMAPIMAVGALQKAIGMAPELSWIIGVGIAIMLSVIIVLFKIGIPRFKLLQKMVDKLNLVTRENLTGLRVVRAFNNEKREEAKFEAVNQDLTKLNLFTNRLMVVMQPVMMLVMNFATLAIIWFGAHLIYNSTIEIGNMMAFLQYAMQVIMSFLMISIVFIVVPRASVSARRVNEVLATEPTILDPEQPKKMPKNVAGQVEFRNVSFSYPGADTAVLSGITFVAEPGQTTAFIGSTGSGKTTLINLIPRFYDVTEGQVLVDGVDVRDMRQHDLHALIGYAPQKGVLFSGTVASNIRYGRKELSDTEMKKAADIAQASEFIAGLDETFEHDIAQGGANVSGGQKQRLAIARALAVDPALYIFDDSFSALDFKTDAKLRRALATETAQKTVIIVAQRIGTIAGADKIIVLDEGRIVGQGTHAELLKTNAVYREIAASQLSDEELKVMGAAAASKPAKEVSRG